MIHYFEEIAIGEKSDLGSHKFSRQEIIDFALKFDPQRFHLDDQLANESLFGGLCASGWHTAAVGMRKLVDARMIQVKEMKKLGQPIAELGPAYGVKNLKWHAPVYPNDVISYSVEILGKEINQKRPNWGIIQTSTSAAKSDGQIVLSYESRVLVERDPRLQR